MRGMNDTSNTFVVRLTCMTSVLIDNRNIFRIPGSSTKPYKHFSIVQNRMYIRL